MIFTKKGMVLVKGSSGQIDYYAAKDPSIIRFNDSYYLYYSSKYTTAPSYFSTSFAISKDGMNFIKKGVVLPVGGAGEIDEGRAYAPSALVFNNRVYLYYTATDSVGVYRVALAISKDGTNFVKKGVVLDTGGVGEVDSDSIDKVSVVYFNNKFYAFYTACDGSVCRVALAISKDGMNFVKKGIVLDLGNVGEIDDNFIYYCDAKVINNRIYLYYMALSSIDSFWRIALAISKDGMNFTKKGVVLNVGNVGEIDDDSVFSPSVLHFNNRVYLYYSCDVWDQENIALAIS